MEKSPRPPFSLAPGLLALAAALALAPALAPSVRAQDQALQEAIARYDAAEFQQAIDLLVAVVERPGAAADARIEALRYLGRAYVAERRMEQAREALDRMLDLEPPPVELDPELEHPDLLGLYYEARRDHGGGYAVERADPGLTTLAVMDFTNTSVDRREDFAPLQQGFASMMIQYLTGATGLRVIERERIRWLLDELALQRDPALVDPEQAVRAGRLLGATAVLFGAFTAHRDRLWISARVVKVETGEVLLAEQAFGSPDDFFELVERLSVQVAGATNATLDREGVGERRDTRSLDAMLAYSRGLALVEGGDLAGAEARFREALEHDPGYARAQRRLDALHPFVAAAQAP